MSRSTSIHAGLGRTRRRTGRWFSTTRRSVVPQSRHRLGQRLHLVRFLGAGLLVLLATGGRAPGIPDHLVRLLPAGLAPHSAYCHRRLRRIPNHKCARLNQLGALWDHDAHGILFLLPKRVGCVAPNDRLIRVLVLRYGTSSVSRGLFSLSVSFAPK
jgi:hypothetical protein